jgi:methyltransferase (TIGR00027 family)
MHKKPKHKVSKTARVTRFTRAMSYYDKDPLYQSDDYIAPVLLSPRYRLVVRNPLIRFIYRKRFGGSGVYEYVIARTRIIDGIFKNLSTDISQVLIFGAGFDSRAVRFEANLRHATIFELDSPSIQQVKIKRYRQTQVGLPPNLRFVPIDFHHDSLPGVMSAGGIQKNMKSLHLLEGLVYYLDPASVDSAFSVIRDYSAKGSLVVFDSLDASVLRREGRCYGEERCYRFVTGEGEGYRSSIERGQEPDFLSRCGLRLLEVYDTPRLEALFFTDASGHRLARVNGMHTIILAEKI